MIELNRLNGSEIKGSGWLKETEYGCSRKRVKGVYQDFRGLCEQLLNDGVFSHPVKNSNRFDGASWFVTISIALALHDAGISYAQDQKQNIGILGTSQDGSLDANLAYFRDYVQYGRKLGRGNLFIYTLPSSPLAEAAIHFGLQGPLLYIRPSENLEEGLVAQAELMVLNKEATTVLAVMFNAKEAICRVISKAGQ